MSYSLSTNGAMRSFTTAAASESEPPASCDVDGLPPRGSLMHAEGSRARLETFPRELDATGSPLRSVATGGECVGALPTASSSGRRDARTLSGSRPAAATVAASAITSCCSSAGAPALAAAELEGTSACAEASAGVAGSGEETAVDAGGISEAITRSIDGSSDVRNCGREMPA